jgi:hypothetical protein
MANAARIDAQNLTRTVALQPIWGGFDSAAGKQIVGLAPFIQVLIECREYHAGTELDLYAIRICARTAVREAEDFTE